MFHPATFTPSRACTTCKKRKRACDKKLPTCSSCNWLQTCCVYEVPANAAMPVKEAILCSSPHHSESRSKSISFAIQDHLMALFYPPNNLHATAQTYFTRTHPWLPFLSRRRFDHRLSGPVCSAEDHAFLLLSCVMHLIVTIPAAAELGSQRSDLYKDTKRLTSLAESEGPQTLDLVQCRLLLALYEINHGATDEAYLSLGMCSRGGIVLRLDRHLQQQQVNDDWPRFEEERRTWWAIIILDRFLRQQRPDWPSAVRDPGASDILPMDDAEWDRTRHDKDVMQGGPPPVLRISTQSHIRVGYFARLAQVSHLLGLVLNNAYNPTPDLSFNEQEADQLRRTLYVYAELLPREATATECSHYCGVVMMCYSAQLFLEQSTSTSEINSGTEGLTDDMVQMAKELNLELELLGPELLRPLALYAIYQVASMYVRKCEFKTGLDGRHRDGIRTLLQLLEIFDERWKLAGVYRAEILVEIQRLQIFA